MKRAERKIRLTGRLLFFAYILILIYFLFFAEWYNHAPGIREEVRLNLRPFAEIGRFWHHRDSLGFRAVFLNLAGNVIGFIPVGFILPVIDRKFSGFFGTLLTGIALSVIVEILQLLTHVGICDIDDVILNAAGTIIGYVLFRILRRYERKRFHAKKQKIQLL